eukprot:CAMPEP_0177287954 /NCGR_PEP_ID=MMETSP0367-20130122/74416_1 /TAXON_ID=447022 ORGANISM="Scrippsiella hangoei-like, Strain SHHI-4" /NCGR_SAMPLE_ID=MMETSP0367 /ASSEMBLY_ACC=CAM_ASM_000362 /LENGTH=176 /DNA_ID=CAMNT_0018745271 /DNA_START=201 /DNA_END=732 /DNA_ORIENTATION=+
MNNSPPGYIQDLLQLRLRHEARALSLLTPYGNVWFDNDWDRSLWRRQGLLLIFANNIGEDLEQIFFGDKAGSFAVLSPARPRGILPVRGDPRVVEGYPADPRRRGLPDLGSSRRAGDGVLGLHHYVLDVVQVHPHFFPSSFGSGLEPVELLLGSDKPLELVPRTAAVITRRLRRLV